MAGEIQLNSVSFATETSGLITIKNSTLSSSVGLPSGSIVQVRQFIFTPIARTNSTTMTQITDGVTKFEYDITPKYSDSKILLMANVVIGNSGQNGAHVDVYTKLEGGSYAVVTALQNSSVTGIGVNAAAGILPVGTSGFERYSQPIQYLDSSVTNTTKRWYTFYYRTGSGNYATVNCSPDAFSGSTNVDRGKGSSQMTLMEIKG